MASPAEPAPTGQEMMQRWLVTGGAGFIGSALVRYLIQHTPHQVVVLDKLTYAGNVQSLASVAASSRFQFVRGDIADTALVSSVFATHRPDVVVHLAAESHVDRSIQAPAAFIQTNVVGTSVLLEAARTHWQSLAAPAQQAFRFLHVSTDEVFGDLAQSQALFVESTPYAPSSPYSASKASADHLVRAWHRTYGLPVLLTHCSNNYGPYQFPEKLIPLLIVNALAGKPLPVYGSGAQVRDWLYVDDHVRALVTVAAQGAVGQSYNIGGHNELQNSDMVRRVCALLDELVPHRPTGVTQYQDLIAFVPDRAGHDVRYAIDASKIQHELGWTPTESIHSGLRKTVQWYLAHSTWWQAILDGSYQQYELN